MGAGVTQLPAPLQAAPGWNCGERAAQTAEGEQAIPFATCWQALEPLQRPVFPQVAPVPHCPVGAGWPVGIAAQVPSPLTLQARQVPVQLLAVQQTPSVQNKPALHSLPPPQATPGSFFVVQVPPEQKSVPMQSVSTLQVFLQAVVPHT
jgi:hypothetical protein